MLGCLYTTSELSISGERSLLKSVSSTYYYTLFYQMEENGILESTSIIDLSCLYYIVLSRINNQLNLLVEAWNNHTVRTTNMGERSDFTRYM